MESTHRFAPPSPPEEEWHGNWLAADPTSDPCARWLSEHADDLLTLASQEQTGDLWVILFDRSQTRHPFGSPALLSVHTRSDPVTRTFGADAHEAPTLALAQRWLTQRGADPARFVFESAAARPVDEPSRDAIARVSEGGDRYDLLEHYSDHVSNHTWTILRDHQAPEEYAVHVDRVLPGNRLQVRERSFADLAAARTWARAGEPLPRPAPRAAAARAHTTTDPRPATSPAVVTVPRGDAPTRTRTR
ncbi:hypothetical protein [Streptomyces sp. SID3343]|uniref:hypothetical protein n=1 Tax=Streptomyces sp. SID3343 TaxID=2690260 RepID=UPI001370774D|nr:hypothetical protein [Streptomyces sp. SID3343]MYV97309.1 hypothetical protein [Streptomyces sp. SID3343]